MYSVSNKYSSPSVSCNPSRKPTLGDPSNSNPSRACISGEHGCYHKTGKSFAPPFRAFHSASALKHTVEDFEILRSGDGKIVTVTTASSVAPEIEPTSPERRELGKSLSQTTLESPRAP
jgi:hypothetical protein